MQPLGADYVKFVRELCDINHALLIIDEVQTGIGRTGKWFAFQRDDLSGGVTPDMVTFAKGVAGGFPMGGMIAFGEKLAALFTPGSHAPPLPAIRWVRLRDCATLDVIEDENLVANAEARGEQLRDGIMATGNPLVRFRTRPWFAGRRRAQASLLPRGDELLPRTRSSSTRWLPMRCVSHRR